MDINDLKSKWQNAGSSSVNEKELAMMIKVNQHPILKKLRIKLIIEAVSLIILLLVYYDGFDGDKKPLYVNALLIASILLYVTNNIMGYIFIKNPVRANNILLSVQKHVLILKRLSVFSLLSSIVYAASLILFLTASIEFTSMKYILLAVLILSFAIMFYFSYKKWKNKIDYFSRLLAKYIIDIA